MFPQERQHLIAELIAQRGSVTVSDLAGELGVTTETVRRDLSTLESHGLAQRVHGGAIPHGSGTLIEARLVERDESRVAEKQRIATAALRFIPDDGATLLLDAGTTTMRLVEALPTDRPLTVFTHAVPLAARLADRSTVTLHLLPGLVRTTTHAAVGVETVAALHRLRADIAFIGTNGISASHGLSTPDRAEAATKAAMIAAAHSVIVLCDTTKMGVERTARFADLDDIDVLVTDVPLADELHSAMTRAGVEVVVAS